VKKATPDNTTKTTSTTPDKDPSSKYMPYVLIFVLSFPLCSTESAAADANSTEVVANKPITQMTQKEVWLTLLVQ